MAYTPASSGDGRLAGEPHYYRQLDTWICAMHRVLRVLCVHQTAVSTMFEMPKTWYSITVSCVRGNELCRTS